MYPIQSMQSRPQKPALTCKLCSLWCIIKNIPVLIYHSGRQQKQWYFDGRLPEKFNVNSVEYKKWPAWINQLNGPCEFSISQRSHFLIPHGVNIPPWQASMCDKYLLKKKKKKRWGEGKKAPNCSCNIPIDRTAHLAVPCIKSGCGSAVSVHALTELFPWQKQRCEKKKNKIHNSPTYAGQTQAGASLNIHKNESMFAVRR